MASITGVAKMICKTQAQEIAFEQLKSAGLDGIYILHGCQFMEECLGKYPAPARWIVRFLKPSSLDGSVTDDGDELFVVRIEADSGAVQASCGL